jgi:hypothetical protein
MALWQWDFYLIPRNEALRNVSEIPARMELEYYESIPWWRAYTWDQLYGLLDGILPRHDPPEAQHSRSWGTFVNDSIDLSGPNEVPVDVYLRIDLGNLNYALLKSIISVAQKADFVFYLPDEEKIIDPDLAGLLEEMHKSRKMVFVTDPAKFFADKEYLNAVNRRVAAQVEAALPPTIEEGNPEAPRRGGK